VQLAEDFDDDPFSGANAGRALAHIFSQRQPVAMANEIWLRYIGCEYEDARDEAQAKLERKLLTIEDLRDDHMYDQVSVCASACQRARPRTCACTFSAMVFWRVPMNTLSEMYVCQSSRQPPD